MRAPGSGDGPSAPVPRPVLRRLASLIALTAVIGLWSVHLAPRALGGPVTLIWVRGSSMEPALHGGDLAVLYEATDYAVGEVVAFDIPEGGIVIHRIVSESTDGYRFQGDNRDLPDPWVLPADAVLGRQLLAVPGGARVLGRLRQPGPLAVLSAGFVFLWFLRDRHSATDGGRT